MRIVLSALVIIAAAAPGFAQVVVSPDLISTVTDGVLEEVQAWQVRPLEPLYPLVVFDALFVSIRDEGVVRKKAVYLALGYRPSGEREILGLWIEQSEGAATRAGRGSLIGGRWNPDWGLTPWRGKSMG